MNRNYRYRLGFHSPQLMRAIRPMRAQKLQMLLPKSSISVGPRINAAIPDKMFSRAMP
jgi:hypothetical protein